MHADTGTLFDVVAQTAVGPIAEGPRTGILARVVRTGHKISTSGLVRVRLEFARDTGDLAGTLVFGPETVGGRARAEIFDVATTN